MQKNHLRMLSALVDDCCTLLINVSVEANSGKPDQTWEQSDLGLHSLIKSFLKQVSS